MANDDGGEVLGMIIGGIFLTMVMIAAAIAALVIVVAAGSLIGSGVGFVNYCKSFQGNVRLERPRVR